MSEPCYKTPKKPSLECNEKPEEANGEAKEDVPAISSVPPGIIDIDVGVSLHMILNFAMLKGLL